MNQEDAQIKVAELVEIILRKIREAFDEFKTEDIPSSYRHTIAWYALDAAFSNMKFGVKFQEAKEIYAARKPAKKRSSHKIRVNKPEGRPL